MNTSQNKYYSKRKTIHINTFKIDDKNFFNNSQSNIDLKKCIK